MEYLPDAAKMKEADRYTIEEKGIPSMELMERAARSCVKAMEEEALDLSHVCIVCGAGNNGGDGFAIARLLHEKGCPVTVVFAGNESRCTEETRQQIQLFKDCGGAFQTTYQRGAYTVIVDALFGAGLNKEVAGHYRQIIEEINASDGMKLAVDIPSGISASNGTVQGCAFRADMTVTFQKAKLGMLLYPGYEYTGKICISDIGIDDSLMAQDVHTVCSYEESDLKRLLPVRTPDSHKGNYGKTLIIAGSKGMAGAAYLNALAAYRIGAGLVQIYTAEENRVVLQTLLPEAIIKTYDFYDEPELRKLLRWADVICIGSGISTSDKAKKILRTTLEYAEVPCVVDADGLNLLAEHMNYMKLLSKNQYIFTPHMKEMSRMTKVDMAVLKEKKIEVLRKFIEEYPVTCVLKDARTMAGCEGKHPYVNLTGNQAMAKAGSGDVLAGIIAGLLSQGMECFEAATLGVYIHGLAGDAAREKLGSYSVLARDLAEHISSVLNNLNNQEV